jgi:hypothetical protein
MDRAAVRIRRRGDVGHGAQPGPARQPELEGGSAMTIVVVRRER